MHPRFRRARTIELRGAGEAVRVVIAEGFRLRLLGLMRLRAEEIEPLLFPRCRSIHMHGMRTPIDLVWLAIEGDQGRVLGGVKALDPGGRASAPRGGESRRRIAALELPPGEAERLGLAAGAELSFVG